MANTNLYINSFPTGMDEQGFREHFEGRGATIVSTKYFAQHGYGFVKFSTQEEAEMIIQAMDQSYVCENQISVTMARREKDGSGKGSGKGYGQPYTPPPPQPPVAQQAPHSSQLSIADDQVYITDLPNSLTDDGLHDLFSGYGAVKWCRMMVRDSMPTAAAMVQFEDPSQASWVVEKLHGNIPQGLDGPIKVRFKSKGRGKGGYSAPYASPASVPAPPAAAPQPPPVRAAPYRYETTPPPPAPAPAPPKLTSTYTDGNGGTNLCIKGLPEFCDKAYIYEIFAPFGGITSVKVMETSRGVFGFVKYVDTHVALNAIKSCNGLRMPDGSVLEVAVKTSKYSRTY